MRMAWLMNLFLMRSLKLLLRSLSLPALSLFVIDVLPVCEVRTLILDNFSVIAVKSAKKLLWAARQAILQQKKWKLIDRRAAQRASDTLKFGEELGFCTLSIMICCLWLEIFMLTLLVLIVLELVNYFVSCRLLV